MIRAYTADQIRAAEEPLLAAGTPLMARAAHGLAQRTLHHLRSGGRFAPGAHVLLLVGAGSNGGDALHAGALLRRRGVAVTAAPLADALHEEGRAALLRAGGRILPADGADGADGADQADGADGPSGPAGVEALAAALERADLVLDAVLGIGGRSELPAPMREAFDQVRSSGLPVLAVDVPSGLDATTGEAAPGLLHAVETITFGAVKTGLLLPGGAETAERIHLVPIGIEEHLGEPSLLRLESADAAALWPEPGRADSKYTRGVVQITAGSSQYPGAAVLSCSAAARSGAGMVRLDAPSSVVDHVLQARPEIVGGTGQHQSAVIGSGCPGDDPRLAPALAHVREATRPHSDRPVGAVIDAGGLDAIRRGDRFHGDVVLTPHASEAERLAEQLGVDADQAPAALARALAGATGATVLLKGSVTVIAPPSAEEPLRTQDDATGQLASAGTGDVLGGLLGALLAAGLPGPEAAALAALVHGRAGVLASRGGAAPLVALDVASRIPDVVAALVRAHPRSGGPAGADPVGPEPAATAPRTPASARPALSEGAA